MVAKKGMLIVDYEEYVKSLKEMGIEPDVLKLVREMSPMRGYTGLNFNIRVHINSE